MLRKAVHPETPDNEALSSIRALGRAIDRGEVEATPRSYNSIRDELAQVRADLEITEAMLADALAGDPNRTRNEVIRQMKADGVKDKVIMEKFGLRRTQIYNISKSK